MSNLIIAFFRPSEIILFIGSAFATLVYLSGCDNFLEMAFYHIISALISFTRELF